MQLKKHDIISIQYPEDTKRYTLYIIAVDQDRIITSYMQANKLMMPFTLYYFKIEDLQEMDLKLEKSNYQQFKEKRLYLSDGSKTPWFYADEMDINKDKMLHWIKRDGLKVLKEESRIL